MALSLPTMKDPALRKFCGKHDLYDTVAGAYHYLQKYFPTATNISLRFRPPYAPDEPEDASITFGLKTEGMTVDEMLDAEKKFIKATNNIRGIEYIVLSYFYESS